MTSMVVDGGIVGSYRWLLSMRREMIKGEGCLSTFMQLSSNKKVAHCIRVDVIIERRKDRSLCRCRCNC